MRMCNAMTSLGHEVTLIARGTGEFDWPAAQRHYGIDQEFTLVRLPWPQRRHGSLNYAAAVRSYLRRIPKPDLVYGRCAPALIAASCHCAPVVYEAHAAPTGTARAITESLLFLRSQFTRLVVISSALRDHYTQRFGFLLKNTSIVCAHDGADCPSVPIRQRVATSRPKVGYVGMLYEGKGAEVVVEVARRLPEIDFELIGGPENLVRHWRQQTRHLKNVEFCGYIPPSEVPKRLTDFSVLLLPPGRRVAAYGGGGDISRWMSPLKMFEYMASGVPILAADLPVLREVLVDGVNALIAPPDNPSIWAERVLTLLQDSKLASDLARNARQTLEQAYTWRARAAKVLDGLRTNS